MKFLKILLMVFLLIGCVTNPKTPLVGEKVAVTVEGLGDYPYVENAYTKELEAMGYTVYNLNYKFEKPIEAHVCIGHSFGGGRLMKFDVSCEIAFTLDAREWRFKNNDSYFSHYPKHYNFWEQRSLLRGYPIGNAINIEIKDASHIRLPRAAKSQILSILKNLQ